MVLLQKHTSLCFSTPLKDQCILIILGRFGAMKYKMFCAFKIGRDSHMRPSQDYNFGSTLNKKKNKKTNTIWKGNNILLLILWNETDESLWKSHLCLHIISHISANGKLQTLFYSLQTASFRTNCCWETVLDSEQQTWSCTEAVKDSHPHTVTITW